MRSIPAELNGSASDAPKIIDIRSDTGGFEIKKDIYIGLGKESSSSPPSSPTSSTSSPVRLTIMVREPQKVLAHSIPIKLNSGMRKK